MLSDQLCLVKFTQEYLENKAAFNLDIGRNIFFFYYQNEVQKKKKNHILCKPPLLLLSVVARKYLCNSSVKYFTLLS